MEMSYNDLNSYLTNLEQPNEEVKESPKDNVMLRDLELKNTACTANTMNRPIQPPNFTNSNFESKSKNKIDSEKMGMREPIPSARVLPINGNNMIFDRFSVSSRDN
jgi:hypothetical protein